MNRFLTIDRFSFAMGICSLLLLWLSVPLEPMTQAYLLAPAVALFGLPHGALDLQMGRKIWAIETLRGHALFLLSYIAIACLALVIWLCLPTAALAAFLAYSAYHFSGDWHGAGHNWRLGGGCVIIGAPCLFHAPETLEIFIALSQPAGADLITGVLSGIGLLGAWLTIISAIRNPEPDLMVEHAILWLGAITLPPLLFFVGYFCFLHSIRHLVHTLRVLEDVPRALISCAVLTLLTITLSLIAYVFLARYLSVSEALLSVIFIGLSCLTVPHMLLVDLFESVRAPIRDWPL